uniref:Uncharacterized protein n=1 Tax=Leersia perrieri TaxID=77586 RepID=A0A0D9V8M1_9ORYZ
MEEGAPDGGGGEAATPPVALLPLLPPPQMVVLALDATRDHREEEIRMALRSVVTRGDILRGGDSLLVLAVLHPVADPNDGCGRFLPTVGHQTKACTGPFASKNMQYLGDQVVAKAKFYGDKLCHDVEELRKVGINVALKVSPGSPAKAVIIHEVNSSGAAWVVLDRHFKRDFRHLEKHIACKVAVFQDNLVVQQLKTIRTIASSKCVEEVKVLEHLAASLDLGSETADTDTHNEIHDISNAIVGNLPYLNLTPTMSAYARKYTDENMMSRYDSSLIRANISTSWLWANKESMRFILSEIQAATSDFLNENLLGKGGFEHDVQGPEQGWQGRFWLIAARLRKGLRSDKYFETKRVIYGVK